MVDPRSVPHLLDEATRFTTPGKRGWPFEIKEATTRGRAHAVEMACNRKSVEHQNDQADAPRRLRRSRASEPNDQGSNGPPLR